MGPSYTPITGTRPYCFATWEVVRKNKLENLNLVEKEASNHKTSKYELLSVHGEAEGGGGAKTRNEVFQTNVAVLLSVH